MPRKEVSPLAGHITPHQNITAHGFALASSFSDTFCNLSTIKLKQGREKKSTALNLALVWVLKNIKQKSCPVTETDWPALRTSLCAW